MRFPSMLLALGALATCLPGCSAKDSAAMTAESAAGAAPLSVSGSRLRARFLEAGGTRVFVGFHDLERQEDCTFQPAEGKTMRCFPATANYTPSGGAFADAACSVAAGAAPTGCATDVTYVLVSSFESTGNCGHPTRFLRKLLDQASPRYVRQPGGECTPQLATGPAILPGEIVPWSAFVAANEEVVAPASGENVSRRVLVGADGSRQQLGYRIESQDVECTFNIMSDGVTRCVPTAGRGQVSYRDDACSASFIEYYANECTEAPRFWIGQDSFEDACALRKVFAIGGLDSASADAYTKRYKKRGEKDSTTSCEAVPSYGYPSAGRRALTGEITGSLPTRARVLPGSSRLVPALVAVGAGTELEPGWHDTERDVDCSFVPAGDGKMRCLPIAGNVTVLSTDGACTSPTKVAVLGQSSCVAASALYGRVTSSTCPITTRIYALEGAPRSLTVASLELSPGRCATAPSVSNAFEATEVAPTAFVEGVPVTE